MSETYQWATLDNADAIELKDLGVDVSVGTKDGDKYNLLKSQNFKAIKTYNIEDNDGMYDSWADSVAANYIKAGNCYGIKVAANYFKSGTLKTINLLNVLRDVSPTLDHPEAKFDILVVAIMRNNKYTVVDYAKKEYFTSNEHLDEFYTEAHKNKGWKRSLFNLENGVSLEIDEDGYNILDDSTAALLFFAPRETDEPTLREKWAIGTTFSHDEFIEWAAESISHRKDTEKPDEERLAGEKFYHIRTVCLYRSLKDACSFLYETSGNTLTGGASSAPDYIPYLWYEIDINVISDHVEGNFNKYHLDADEVNEISLIKYNAPFIPSLSKINAVNATWDEIYLSDKSLRGITYSDSRRISKFNLAGKTISSISVPLNATYPWLTNYQTYYKNGLESGINDDYGILYMPMFLEVKTSENGIWHRSTNAIAQNSPRLATSYGTFLDKLVDWTFTFDNIPYEGRGLYIRVINAERTYYDSIPAGKLYRRLNVAELAISYYQPAILNEGDYIHLSRRSASNDDDIITVTTETINVTAPVKVYFDYNLRAAWNELVENHIAENEFVKYETFSTKDVAIANNLNAPDDTHHANTWVLNGVYSPVTPKNFYLNTITFYTNSNQVPALNDTRQYYLQIQSGNAQTGIKTYYSINSLFLNNTMTGVIPTWIFDINDQIGLSGEQLTIKLVYKDTDDTFTPAGADENGLSLKQYAAPGTNCSMSRSDGTYEHLGEIYFGFKYDKIKIIEKRLDDLENKFS